MSETTKACPRCNSAMTPHRYGKVGVTRDQWDSLCLPENRGELEKMLQTMERPYWLCHPCLNKAREGKYLSSEEAFADIEGCTVEEAKARLKKEAEKYRRYSQTPGGKTIHVTVEDVRKALARVE